MGESSGVLDGPHIYGGKSELYDCVQISLILFLAGSMRSCPHQIWKQNLLLKILGSSDQEQSSCYGHVLASLENHELWGQFRMEAEVYPEKNADYSYRFWQKIFAEDSDNWHKKAESNNFMKVVDKK